MCETFLIKFFVRFKATMIYILLIPAVNMILVHAPILNLSGSTHYTPASLLVGLVYIARDFTQRELGHKLVFLPMVLAAMLTYALGSPAMATASLTAFVCGELTEWAIFTYTGRPFPQRILLSCALALPIDILIVLIGLHFAAPGLMPINPLNMLLMYGNNMLSVIAAYFLIQRVERINPLKSR